MTERIRGEITIKRPADAVFDFCADERNEPRYNPRMTHVEMTSSGPIGLGSQFRAETSTMGRTTAMISSGRRMSDHGASRHGHACREWTFEGI